MSMRPPHTFWCNVYTACVQYQLKRQLSITKERGIAFRTQLTFAKQARFTVTQEGQALA